MDIVRGNLECLRGSLYGLGRHQEGFVENWEGSSKNLENHIGSWECLSGRPVGGSINKPEENVIGWSSMFYAISSLLGRCPKDTKIEREKPHLVDVVDVGDRNENLSDCSQKRCIF